MGALFVRRPIVAIVIAILMTIAGAVALSKLPTAQYPDIVPPQIKITTTYTGADAITIEQSVATPLEQQMNGVDNMIYMQSTNANDGTMTENVTFDVETDINIDQVNTQNRVSQAQPNLPADVNQFGLTVKKSTSNPLIMVALFSPKGTYDALFLGNYATINVNDALYRVPGVGQIQNYGTADYAMRIWVKPERLASLGLTVPDLLNAVKQQSTVNPSGGIGTEPSPKGQEFTYTVRSQGRLVSGEEFGNVVVRLNPDGSVVRLKDVSRIELGALNYQQRARLNGKPSCPIGIFQVPGSNAIAVAEGVKKTMKELKERFPDDLDYVVALDTTLPVTEGIKEIEHTLFEAIVLVILVVFLFLQGWRATLIPLLAVPVSLVGTFILFPMLGFSINTLSLFGLVLAIGLVVDDAIVVVEAVEHHIEHGLSPKDATLKAMEEVTQPVIGIALVLSAVFIPIAFMGGIQGRMSMQFAITIAVSVLISAFNALSLSPALCSLILRPKKESKGPLGKFFAWFNKVFLKITGGYVDLSRQLIRKMVISLVILAGFTALSGVLGKKLPSGFLPNEDQGYFFLNVQLPDASSLQRTDAVCQKIEKILGETKGVKYVTTIAGYSLLSGASAPYTAFYFVALDPWDERKGDDMLASAIVRRLNGVMRSQVLEANVVAFEPPAIQGLGTGGGFSFWLQDRSGGSVDFLNQNLQKFLEAARKRPELANVNSVWRASVPQIYADINRDKVLKQGIAVGDVYQSLQAFLGGIYVNQFNRFGRQWKVFLQAEASGRVKPEDINQF
ncbi:MAG TPA: efflux RND transporter permease subunit, partial [Thermoanaerobaculia bacterium]|nr:efflux RND transporter permease subunit [Thermoanaerobaculia bacterium]